MREAKSLGSRSSRLVHPTVQGVGSGSRTYDGACRACCRSHKQRKCVTYLHAWETDIGCGGNLPHPTFHSNKNAAAHKQRHQSHQILPQIHIIHFRHAQSFFSFRNTRTSYIPLSWTPPSTDTPRTARSIAHSTQSSSVSTPSVEAVTRTPPRHPDPCHP